MAAAALQGLVAGVRTEAPMAVHGAAAVVVASLEWAERWRGVSTVWVGVGRGAKALRVTVGEC